MNSIWIVFAAILLLNSLFALVVAYRLRQQKQAAGSQAMTLLFVALAVWAFSYAMIMLSTALPAKHFWLKIQNIGIIAVPSLWFIFVAQYTRQDRWFRPAMIVSLWIIPLVTWVLLFSGIWSEYYYLSTYPYADNGGPLIIQRGLWYYIQLFQSYTLLAGGIILLLWHVFQYRNIYRKQSVLIISALLAPWLLNTFYQIGASIFPTLYVPFDLTAIAFTITATLLGISIFGFKLFDIIPVARHVVLDHIPEIVLVIDMQSRIIDANSAAQLWLKKDSNNIVGSQIEDVLKPWPNVLSLYGNQGIIHEEIQTAGHPPQHLELFISPLYNRLGKLDGHVIIAHNITEHKEMQHALQTVNTEMTKRLVEIETLQAKLREQAIRDPLTGLYNRRFLAEELDREIARAKRDGGKLSIAIIDVDFFKVFNDTYGHKCGDIVLQHISTILLENTRRSDLVCRYGGEEFVIVMPGSTLELAFQRAEEWRRIFENSIIPHQEHQLRSTFSAGVSVFPLHGEDAESILQAADKALYLSKANGRNRVTVIDAHISQFSP